MVFVPSSDDAAPKDVFRDDARRTPCEPGLRYFATSERHTYSSTNTTADTVSPPTEPFALNVKFLMIQVFNAAIKQKQ